VPFTSPCNLVGSSEAWLYLGPFAAGAQPDLDSLKDLRKVTPGVEGDTYWRLDMPDAWVRRYNENALFGRWNYPLGVTIYGLLHSAKAIDSTEIQQYVRQAYPVLLRTHSDTRSGTRSNMAAHRGSPSARKASTAWTTAALRFVLLEVARHFEIRGFKDIADFVADYITNKQIRLPDGTFFRKNLMHVFHEDTLVGRRPVHVRAVSLPVLPADRRPRVHR